MSLRLHTGTGLSLLGMIAVMSGCASPETGDAGGAAPTGAAVTTGGADCSALQCDPHASCAVAGGSAACHCHDGFEGDGTTCTDVDECAKGTAKCDPSATCVNTPGSFQCTCKQGYSGDGTSCVDVDECAPGTTSCDPNATCQNLAGSFMCACNPGFMGDGKTCTDVDECAQGTAGCDPNATCKNLSGGFACKCNTGFVGDGKTCTDITSCAQVGCGMNATCLNNGGVFSCACDPGYSGDGVTCVDIDECQQMTANCDVNATCQNNGGSFTCACKAGYAGNGVTCTSITMGTPGDVAINAAADTTASTAVTLSLQEPGNLIQDPGGESGSLASWQVLQSGGDGWASTPANRLFGERAFITSFSLDTRSQLLDLTTLGYTQQQLDAAPSITVHEWYQGTGVPSNLSDQFYLKVELRSANNTVLAALDPSATTTKTSAPWQVSAQTFTGYGPGLRYVYFEDGGQDMEFWAGQYGAAMDGASVVVGDVQVSFSNDNTTWSAWQPFAPTLPWTLDLASGMKTVYVKYMDGSGSVWPAVSDTILLQ